MGVDIEETKKMFEEFCLLSCNGGIEADRDEDRAQWLFVVAVLAKRADLLCDELRELRRSV